MANPVALASGAKIQTEADIAGAPNGTLRIARTYRSQRSLGSGQSAGQGWSFSFDRSFALLQWFLSEPPHGVIGAYGDGASFKFVRLSSGHYASETDSRETIRALTTTFDDWILTRRDGSIERFKKVNTEFLLVSSHTKEGLAQLYTYGPDNKLTTIADAGGRTLQLTWAGGVVASITGPTGTVRYGYHSTLADDEIGAVGADLLATVDFYDSGAGHLSTRRYHYEDSNYPHLLTGITNENGVRFATYAYNATGQAVLSEHAGGVGRYTFAYPEESKRIITDPLGTQRQVNITYASKSGLVSGTSQPGGAGCGPGASKLSYDYSGQLVSSTDFNNKKTCFISDRTRGLVTSEVAGLGAADACPASGTATITTSSRRTSKQWHPDLELETAIAGPKQITRYVYNGQPDASGTVASCAAGATLPNGKPIVVMCSKTIQATRDANGATGFAAQSDSRPRTRLYNYDAAGQLLKIVGPTDALGQAETVSNVYYADTTASHATGDLAATTNAVGEETKFLEYTNDGLPSKIQRANGVVASLLYGARQRLTSSTIVGARGGTETTGYAYDDAGQLTSVVFPDGAKLTLGYDDAQRLTDLSDSSGSRIKLTLDNMGNVTRQEHRNAAGVVIQGSNRTFDALNRLASVQRGAQAPTTYLYDRVGNLTAVKDAMGRITTREYDSLDRMTKTTLPAASVDKPATTIQYEYDHQNNVVNVVDPRKLSTRYSVDGYGQLTGLSSPDTATAVFKFDDAGKMISDQNARGVTTGYRYDAARRVTRSGVSTFEYGKDGTTAAGQLVTMNDESGTSSFTYDGFGRLLGRVQAVATATAVKKFAIGYEYGAIGGSTGQVTSMTYPSGNRIGIAYGVDGQAISLILTTPSATAATSILENIQYTALGAVQSWNWGNPASGNYYKREFDVDGKLHNYPLGALGANGTLRTLSYDAGDRIRSIVHSGGRNANRLDQNFFYDDLDRLTRVEGGSVSQAYAYDANGNRVLARFATRTYANAIYSTSNRLMSTSGPGAPKSRTYDPAGNLTSDGVASYTYGTNGRMTAVSVAGVVTRYRYNGFGERVEKAGATGSVTYYIYGPAGHLIGEYDQAGNAIQETVYLGDLPVAVLKPREVSAAPAKSATEVYAIYADHILTPRVITRLSDSRMVWRWDNSDPFGLQQPDESPAGSPKFTYDPRFPGQVFDRETNNHYNYFRDYDPQTGRYVQSDPIGLDGGINTYGYVGGNPVNAFDFYGLAQCSVVFNGGSSTNLKCIPDDPSRPTLTIPVASGNNGGGSQCKNQQECDSQSSRGPLPAGNWKWNLNGPGAANSKPNGRRLVALPGTNTKGRSGFLTHSCINAFGPSTGPSFCSEGCITGSAPHMQSLNNLLQAEPNSTLHVGP